MVQTERGTTLTIFAALFAILALSNLLKPLQIGGEETGFVLFGTRLAGTPNVIAGIIAGLYLLVYAYGIWNMKRFAVGMAHAYALYVILNLLMFMFRDIEGADQLGIIGSIAYSGVAIGVSLGSAIMLTKRKAELA
jgi:hypothetical protein